MRPMMLHKMRNEQGNISLLLVVCTVVLTLVFGVALDFGLAFAQKSAQDDALALAREEILSPAFALKLKNSPTPEQDIAERIVESLRFNGTDAKVHVHVIEAPPEDVPENKRAIAYYVVLEGTYSPILLGMIIDGIPLASASSAYAIPYSTTLAWRPGIPHPGEYTAEAAQTSLVYRPASPADMPEALARTLDEAIEQATGETEKENPHG